MLFRLRIPAETRLLGVVHDLTLKVAESNGYAPGEAQTISRAIDEAAAEAAAQHPRAHDCLDVRYCTSGQRLEVGVFFYPCRAEQRRREKEAGSAGQATAPADDAPDEGVVYHRLVRPLPRKRSG
jgi:hypothetical protein